MQILLLGVLMTLCAGHSLAVLNSAQSSSSFGDSKDKAAAGYQYNEPAQQYQPLADTQLGYHYQAPFTQQQQQQQQQEQQSASSAGYQYQAQAQQYPTATATQIGMQDTQSGYHYQASSSQQQQQPASIGSNFYQHSSLGPALALDVDNALPAKLSAQAGHFFVHNQQSEPTTQAAGYNYLAPSPNQPFATSQQQPQRDTLPHTAAASPILANSNSALLHANPNSASERQNYLLQKLAQLNLLSGTKAGAFSAGQGQTHNLLSASQEPQKIFNAQFTPTNGQQENAAFDSFRQSNQDYAYARPTNNKQQVAYFGEAAASTTLSNFEHNKQHAVFDEVQQSSAQTAHLENNEKYAQSLFAGNHPLLQSASYNNQQTQQQLQLGSQSNGYNYAAQGNNGFNAGSIDYSAANKALTSSIIAGSQHALSQNAAGHKTSSYYQASPNSQQQSASNSALLSGEQLLREQAQQQQYNQQHQPQQYQHNTQLASLALPALGLPATAYVYQKTQSQSYELPTIVQQQAQVQQPAQLQSQSTLHQAVRQPHVLYGTPLAEREESSVSASAPGYSSARGQYQAPYF